MNFVFIVMDQFRFDCLSLLNHKVVKTPNIDSLAKKSVVFKNSYCATMACGPARASIFTGMYSDSHGMKNNSMNLTPESRAVLPEILKGNGYDTALVGKLHLKPIKRDFGFRYILRHDAPYTSYDKDEALDSAYIKYLQSTVYKDNPEKIIELFTKDEDSLSTDEERFILGRNHVDEEHHETAWVARESIKYLKSERDKDKPFFLNCSFYGPHQPYACPGRWGRMYDPDKIPLPDDFYFDVEDKPIIKNSFHYERMLSRKKDGWGEKEYKKILCHYYGYISMIDHSVGKIIEALKEEALFDNTMIVLTSDHGDFAGQYGLFYKGTAHEGSTHIPMIVRHPESKLSGQACGNYVNSIDLFATFLAQAGVALPEGSESVDFSELFLSDKPQGKYPDRIFWKIKNSSMMIQNGWKLCRMDMDSENLYELYNLNESPMEEVNLYHKYKDEQIIIDMINSLGKWHMEQNAVGK
jgi:arylsulfatase A-like enzyme